MPSSIPAFNCNDHQIWESDTPTADGVLYPHHGIIVRMITLQIEHALGDIN